MCTQEEYTVSYHSKLEGYSLLITCFGWSYDTYNIHVAILYTSFLEIYSYTIFVNRVMV